MTPRTPLPLLLIALLSGFAVSAPAALRAQAPAIAQFTSGMQSQEGFIPVHLDPETGKVFLEIARFGEDVLYLNALATGLGSARAFRLDAGGGGDEAVVRFERRGPRVVMVRRNTNVTATSGDPGQVGGAEKSFPVSVLASMPIVARSGERVLVDATDFLMSDMVDVRGAVRSYGFGQLQLDRDRGFVVEELTRAFPGNSEIRTSLTFVTDDPHSEIARHTPDGRFLTLQQHHSFVQLPDEPMETRAFDPRTGNSGTTVQDYSEGFDEDYRMRYVSRWRLEKRDPNAEISEPVQPIVYYLDPAIPEPYRTAYRRGVEWWNQIFESAGFRDAVQVRDLPEGADPMDARYSVIQLVNRSVPGPSTGGGRSDPRTGEILVAMPRMDSHRSFTDYNIYAGLLPTYDALGRRPQLSAEEFAMARRSQLAAHEVGHSLGFPHNFIAHTQNRSSVMDYPFPLIELDGGGGLDISNAYRLGGGASDTVAVRYAYTQFADEASEARGLEAVVRDALDRGVLSLNDGGLPAADPDVHRWVAGDDMFEALDRTMAVRRILMEHFDERAIRPGEPLAWLNARFAHVYLHHRYSTEGMIKHIGGVRTPHAMRGDGQTPVQVIPAADQRRALSRIMDVLSPAELAVPARIQALIPPPPPGYGEPSGWVDPAVGVALPPAVGSHAQWIESPAGPVMDPLAVSRSYAQEVVDNLLHRERLARVVSFHAADPGQLSLDELLRTLVDGTWGVGTGRGGSEGAVRRTAERSVLDALFTVASDARATSEVRDAAHRHLDLLRERLAASPGQSAEDQAHRGRARREISRFLDDGEVPPLRTGVIVIPLPWP